MAEKVWSRDYLEKAGATVEWDDETKTVVVDGWFHVPVDEISDGKSYVDKRVLDTALIYTGHDIPSETPRTSRETDKMRRSREEEERWEEQVSRAIPGWTQIKDYIYRHAYKPLRDWVVDHIWKPVKDWIQSFRKSLGTWVDYISVLYIRVSDFLHKVKYKIQDSTTKTYNSIVERYETAVNWLKQKIPILDWTTSNENINLLTYLQDTKTKIIWFFTDIFDDVRDFFTRKTDVISEHIVQGFSNWCERVFDMVEDYIVKHWED